MNRKKFESDMDSELRFHIDAYIADLVRSGVPRAEAERRARVEFGAVEARKDECRQAWGLQRLDDLRADLRLAFRTFRRNPGFTAIAIVSLALGVGANTAIFGLVDAVMLRLLPVHDPASLVFIQNAGTGGPDGGPPYPCFELLRDKTKSFAGMAAFSASNMEFTIDGAREQVRGLWVSDNFYDLLGVKPLIGRTLSGGPVAVISHAYWQQRFGGNPAVLGRAIRAFEHTVTIVGVMPTGSMGVEPGRPFDVAVPIELSDPVMLRERGSWWLDVAARLKPGVRPEQARAEADALFHTYMADVAVSPAIRKESFDHIELTPAARGMEGLRKQFSKPLTALMILVALVLLAACANLANLMLARAAARQKEFAVRLAIGAGRGRLIRQTLTEALVLAGSGSALGIILALRAESALAAFFADGNNRIVLDLSLNARMLLFTLAVSVVTGIASGVLPALRSSRLQIASRGAVANRSGLRLGRALVIVQVALSTVLLAAAGLFIHSLHQLESTDLGFTREPILTMEVTPDRSLYGKPEWFALQTEILARVQRIPGVRAASWSTMSPLSGRDRGVWIEVPGFVPRSETDLAIHVVSASPEYFDTFRVPLLAGRTFSARDNGRVAVINESAARFYFGKANPIGTKVKFTRRAGEPVYQIAGVVKDAKHQSVRAEPWRFIYLPVGQSIERINRLALAVRYSGPAQPIMKEVLAVRSTLLITNVSTMEKQVQLSLIKERLVSSLSTAFGALALILACIGLYGILAYAVTRRTNEIGIRMALGATGNGMIWLVLREALLLAACGIIIGLPAVFALGRITKALLYGVQPFDPPAFACAVLLLLFFAAIAGIVPARRAGRLDPMSALRCE